MRAGYLVSADGQGDVLLTAPEQAHWSDDQLRAEALAELDRAGISDFEPDQIKVGEYRMRGEL